MLVTALLMLVQLVVGYQFNVLSLVAESYHMLNDVVAFVVQLYAYELGQLKREHSLETTAFSYGFGRVEMLANLIQGVLLVALCLTLGLESLQRFYSSETITLPPLVVGIGAVTLVWNLVMFRLFEASHHRRGHDDHEHSLCHPLRYRQRLMRDALGTVVIILDGVLSWLFGPKNGVVSGVITTWKGSSYIDPLCSVAVVYLILKHAFPLMTKSSFALMHAFDPVKATSIRRTLAGSKWLPQEVAAQCSVSLEDLHIWSLSETSRFATARFLVTPHSHSSHLTADKLVSMQEAAKRVLRNVVPPSQV
ncbi:hypothetical protein JCM10207_002982 [Rhodosporidiobolus poonsookiae]